MPRKANIIAHHHKLGLFLLFLMMAAIPFFILAINQPSVIVSQAFYPKHCQSPKIPRTEVCSTSWVITKDQETGCRIFSCQDTPLSKTN